MQIPQGYISIKEETSLMAGEAFFVPGSTERSWNATTPSTRILVREDLYQQVKAFLLSGTCLAVECASLAPVQMGWLLSHGSAASEPCTSLSLTPCHAQHDMQLCSYIAETGAAQLAALT